MHIVKVYDIFNYFNYDSQELECPECNTELRYVYTDHGPPPTYYERDTYLCEKCSTYYQEQ